MNWCRQLLLSTLTALMLAGCVTNQKAYENALNDPDFRVKDAIPIDGMENTTAPDPQEYSIANISPEKRPVLESDEAGLWMVMDKQERKLATSGNIVKDKELNDYVSGIVCKLAGQYCGSIRTYVVRTPHFNASMAPNGTMQVWTGLLLRVRNEAQLASVLGHEIGHYLRRHTVQRMRDSVRKANFVVFFQMATLAAGVGVAGDVAALVAAGSIQSFSRDHEREADGYGSVMLYNAGYDPREAAKVWEQVEEEMSAEEDRKNSVVFASHPPSVERGKMLRSLAEKLLAQRDHAGRLGVERFQAVMAKHRSSFFRDELNLRQFKRTEKLLSMLKKSGIPLAEIHFTKGEMYRLRGEEGDSQKALDAYKKTLETGNYRPETHRSMGLVYREMSKPEEARRAFANYLAAAPKASDKEMIKFMMRQGI